MAGRASPAVRADEDIHNPSVDGLLYVSVAWLLQRSETVAPTRGLSLDILDIPDIPGGDRRSYASLQPLEGFDVVVVGIDDAGIDF